MASFRRQILIKAFELFDLLALVGVYVLGVVLNKKRFYVRDWYPAGLSFGRGIIRVSLRSEGQMHLHYTRLGRFPC